MVMNLISKASKRTLPMHEFERQDDREETDMFTNIREEKLLLATALTDRGLLRSKNEDSFSVADLATGTMQLESDFMPQRIGERGALLVVADGMGGAAAGKLASEMAVIALRESLIGDKANHYASIRLANATEFANHCIYEFAKENPEVKGMGTTLTAALVQGHSVCISQVGDSRAYLIRDEKICQLTKDQTLVQQMIDAEQIALEEIANYPRHIILQAVGIAPTVNYALFTVELYHNDCLLLCSDGLSNKVSAEEIRKAVKDSANLPDACTLLVDLANARGGEDNITVIIARLFEAKLLSQDDAEFDFAKYDRAA